MNGETVASTSGTNRVWQHILKMQCQCECHNNSADPDHASAMNCYLPYPWFWIHPAGLVSCTSLHLHLTVGRVLVFTVIYNLIWC